jgi:protease-4
MGLEADLLIDRRRLKRRLALWRAAAVLLLAGLVGGWLLWDRDGGDVAALFGGRTGHVARLPVEGFIGEDPKLAEALDKLGRDRAVRALIVSIDSPGGSVAGGEALHAALGRVRESKPVVAVMRGTAASAGYMVALPAERIFAREATVTGSIGVILQSPDVSALLAQVGVRMETVASGPLKDQPSPFRALTEEGRAWLDKVVADLYDQFVVRVAAARRMEPAAVRALADGRVMTGRQALEAGLIDALGGEEEALDWLSAEAGVPRDAPVRDVAPEGPDMGLGDMLGGAAARAVLDAWAGAPRPMAILR